MTKLQIAGCKITVVDSHSALYEDTLGRKVKKPLPLGTDDLTIATINRLSAWVEDHETFVKGADLQLLGRHLYHCLFGAHNSELHKQFRETWTGFQSLRENDNSGSHRLRLRLAFDAKAGELATFPWEFLYVDEGPEDGFFFAGKRTELILTRFVPPTEFAVLTPDEDPLNILIVVCSPNSADLGSIDGKALIKAVRQLERPGLLEVRVVEDNPRFSQIENAISPEHGSEWWPDVFHFIGHGKVSAAEVAELAVRAEEADEDTYYAETGRRDARVAWIPTSKIQELFPKAHQPRLVFLHACRGGSATAMAQSYRGFRSGATDLVRAGVPAVIAMQYEIQSEDALVFAQHFYKQVGQGLPIDDAVTDARYELATKASDSWNNRRFGTPLLFLQSRDSMILREPPANGDGAEDKGGRDENGFSEAQAESLLACPYKYDPQEKCKGMVEYPLRLCPTCNQRLVWCENPTHQHPNKSDAKECMRCESALELSSRRVTVDEGQSPLKRVTHGTGFGS